jgi:aminomethyltransferase
MAVREGVGIFDASHMGEFFVKGENSIEFLNYVTSNNVNKLKLKQAQYSCVCNERGAMKDDIMVYKLADDYFFLSTNAVNVNKLDAWFNCILSFARKMKPNFDVQIENKTHDYALVSIQGPKATETVQKLTDMPLNFKWNYIENGIVGGENVLISHIGYTGENGWELWIEDTKTYHPDPAKRLPSKKVQKVYDAILESGAEFNILEAALGSRDTLRIEAGYTLYGTEAWEEQLPSEAIDRTTPFEASLGFSVDLNKETFIGKDALVKQKEEGLKKVVVRFELLDRGVPRHGYEIRVGESNFGEVTSGTMSPIRKVGIGLAFVNVDYSEIGSEFDVIIRGTPKRARVVEPPFYDTKKYGRKRMS